jgi:hypothetical protein
MDRPSHSLSSVDAFPEQTNHRHLGATEAIAANSTELVDQVPGASPLIVYAGVLAREHAFADNIRYTFVTAARFLLPTFILCYWLGDLKKAMTYHVDAPLEVLTAKVGRGENKEAV